MEDYYKLLGVDKKASPSEIKSAYRKLALKWHPDKNKEVGAENRFKKINEEYEILSDEKKRQLYDQVGHSAFKNNGGRGNQGPQSGGPFGGQGGFRYYSNAGGAQNVDFDFGGVDPFDIFEQFFGFRSPNGGRRKPRNAYQMNLTFDEAIKGVSKKAVIGGEQKTIKIPAGVDTGMKIRFADFDIVVNVAQSKDFKRQKQDVYIEQLISFPQAVLGDTVQVKTIDGFIKLKVKSGTQSGSVVRLKGKGIPYPNSSQKGDQYVVWTVEIPTKISGSAKKIIESLKNEL